MKRLYSQNKQFGTKNSKKKIMIITLLLIVAVIAIIFFSLKGCTGTNIIEESLAIPIYLEDIGSSAEGEAETKSREEILTALKSQQLIVTDKLNSNIVFPSGAKRTVGNWTVENPKENDIIQQAEVYLNETLIAKSTPIYPNQHITEIELLEELETGEYVVLAYINYYDLDSKEFISKAGYEIHLTIR